MATGVSGTLDALAALGAPTHPRISRTADPGLDTDRFSEHSARGAQVHSGRMLVSLITGWQKREVSHISMPPLYLSAGRGCLTLHASLIGAVLQNLSADAQTFATDISCGPGE